MDLSVNPIASRPEKHKPSRGDIWSMGLLELQLEEQRTRKKIREINRLIKLREK